MATINGTSGNDTLTGGSGSDRYNMGEGNDTLDAGGGNDTLYGGTGNDTMYGGTGNDTLFGESEDDVLHGDIGDDTIYGGTGYDSLYGGSGNDTLFGDDDFYDDLYGGTGDDTIYAGNFDENWAYGGDGNDVITDGSGAGLLVGDAGDDRIYAGAGNDTVYGGDGNDSIDAGAGNDEVFGGEGNDTLVGGTGDDTLYAGLGRDTLYGGDGNDLLIRDGTDTNDVLNQYFGGAGNDTIRVQGGINVNDQIDGGDGTDLFEILPADNRNLTVDMGAGEVLDGTVGTQQFVNIENVTTGGGNDTIIGDGQNNVLSGGAGNDSISAGLGDDEVFGGTGNDTLQGGGGNDTLTGGDGNDTFDFVRGGDADVVTDFSLTDTDADGFTDDQLDVSDLRDLEGNPVNAWDVTVTDDGSGNALLTFPEGETILLLGVTPAQMQTAGQKFAAGIPCFTTGTMIRTPGGEVPIEMLRPGDKVLTRDNGPQPLVWVGMRHLGAADLKARPDLRPVVFAPGALGQEKRLLVSPQHGVLVGQGAKETLARAVHLARLPGGKVRVAKGVKSVTYVHLMFESHQVIWGNGLPSESFYPGPWGLSALVAPALLEIAQLFPDAVRLGAEIGYGPTARPVRRFSDLASNGPEFALAKARLARWLPRRDAVKLPKTRAVRLH